MFEGLIRGKIPIIIVNTVEVLRFYRLLKNELDNINNKLDKLNIDDDYIKTHGYQIFTFDAIYGFKIESNCIDYPERLLITKGESDVHTMLISIFTDAPSGVYVIPMAHHIFENYYSATLMIDACRKFEAENKYIILLGDASQMPLEIRNLAVTVDLGFPDKNEIALLVKELLKINEVKVTKEQFKKIVTAITGISYKEAENGLKKWLVDINGKVKDEDIKKLFGTKAELVKNSGLLEVVETSDTLEDIGGMNNLKKWSEEISYIYNRLDEAIDFGITIPKGCLLTGISGCGKTLFAKAIANKLGFPLYRLDIGRLLGSLVGETERNTRELLKMLDSISPCIILLDEIEKMFSGINSSDRTDGGVISRLIGNMLYYMEERNKPAFFIATANDISALPPELLRKGRWDEIWFIDLPTEQEIKDILRIHINKRGCSKDSTLFNFMIRDAKNLVGFTGAELEQIVENVFRKLFIYKDTVHLADAYKEIVSNSSKMVESRKKYIEELRNWASISTKKAN